MERDFALDSSGGEAYGHSPVRDLYKLRDQVERAGVR
jgi:hypothetical protein